MQIYGNADEYMSSVDQAKAGAAPRRGLQGNSPPIPHKGHFL